jgi:hypothetical protein
LSASVWRTRAKKVKEIEQVRNGSRGCEFRHPQLVKWPFPFKPPAWTNSCPDLSLWLAHPRISVLVAVPGLYDLELCIV